MFYFSRRSFNVFLFLGGLLGTSRASESIKSIASCNAQMDGVPPLSSPSDFHFNGNIRRYYIAAEEVLWDYAPSGWDNWLGVPFNSSVRAQSAGYTKFGTKWLKALYRGYTDSSFSRKTTQPNFQGTQGPTIRAEVGDLVEILFFNNLTTNYATIHSMGLAYSKTNEGADYPNNTAPGQNNVLPPGGAVPPVQGGVKPRNCVVYKWMVNDGAGPSGGEPAKERADAEPPQTHSYHSYVSLQEDANTGLIGPTIVYASGAMSSTMATYREIPILYNTYDENISWLSGENNARLTGNKSTEEPWSLPGGMSQGNYTVWYPQLVNIDDSNHFASAPTFYAINGYVFSNNPMFEMCENDNVIWYLNGYGQASHVFHMHGNGFRYNGRGEYAMSVNDGVGKTLYMNATGLGIWQVVCHVQNHLSLGMVADYRVYPQGSCPLAAL